MKRSRVPELMDDPRLPHAEHLNALRALDRTNRLLGFDSRLLRDVLRLSGGRAESLLDVGAGSGGMLRLALRQDVFRRLVGVDVSIFALDTARAWSTPAAARDVRAVQWIAGDALRLPFVENSFDVITCSLFLHHFDEPDVVAILREFARVSRLGVVISDLLRSRVSHALTVLATRCSSRSHVFHVDGPRSVRAAFRPAELGRLAVQAGLHDARILSCPPFRMTLMWRKRGANRRSPASALGLA